MFGCRGSHVISHNPLSSLSRALAALAAIEKQISSAETCGEMRMLLG